MLRRIELILKTQNLTPTQFADKLGIQRSGLSHILAGRNNPSLDFVTKVLSVFPEIQTDWLLFGKGSMYALNATVPTTLSTPTHLMEMPNAEITFENEENQKVKEYIQAKTIPASSNFQESLGGNASELKISNTETAREHSVPYPSCISENGARLSENRAPEVDKNASKIEKIIIFYTNGSFKVYEEGM
ncbi:MAG: helix-turn-helix transcriptional regulator [Bacteroidales bacterium]